MIKGYSRLHVDVITGVLNSIGYVKLVFCNCKNQDRENEEKYQIVFKKLFPILN